MPADAVSVEIDGPNVSPSTVDAVQLLELGSCFFKVVAANAAEQGAPLRLTNVSIRNKCAAVCASADDMPIARAAVDATIEQISGLTDDVPRGTADDIRSIQGIVARMPVKHSVIARVNGWHATMRAPRQAEESFYGDWATLRATPVRIGGSRPTARFVSVVEPEPFTLQITKEQAREIGPSMYKLIEVNASLKRSSDGLIVGGVLQSFTTLQEGDPRPAWRAWFKEVSGGMTPAGKIE